LEPSSRLLRLRQAIDHAAHLLPAQGPITVFIHHNTLHAFEDLPFTEAVKAGARVYGCQPYMSKSRYREELIRGRIRFFDLQTVLREELGARADDRIGCLGTRFDLQLAMLQYPLRYGPAEELLWFVADTDALRRFREDVAAATRARLIAETRRWAMRDLRGGYPSDASGMLRKTSLALTALMERSGAASIETWTEADWEAFTLHALWRVCLDGTATVPETPPSAEPIVRHRDYLLQANDGVADADADLLANEVLIRFCAAFVDQGVAHCPLPGREEGLYRAFIALYRHRGGPPDRWLRGLPAELTRLEEKQMGPLECIRESLDVLGVPEDEWDRYLSATLLALRGWAGILRFLEQRGDRAVRPVPPGSLIEFLAVRLLLDRLAVAYVARETLGYANPLAKLRDELRARIGPPSAPSVEERAFLIFQLAQLLGWTPAELDRLGKTGWATLVGEAEGFPTVERRRIFHLAYELRFYTQTLDALALHAKEPSHAPATPRFQAMFCIDEREESMRRHVEEVAPHAATFGIAGFFFIDMYYRGAADAHFVPLAPAFMRPQHWVVEQVQECHAVAHERQARARRVLGKASHHIHVGSRTFAVGAVLSAAVGIFASMPLIARTLFPRLTSRLRQKVGRLVLNPPPTILELERAEGTSAGPENGHVGFALSEMVAARSASCVTPA